MNMVKREVIKLRKQAGRTVDPEKRIALENEAAYLSEFYGWSKPDQLAYLFEARG
jgi:hypothetical protein